MTQWKLDYNFQTFNLVLGLEGAAERQHWLPILNNSLISLRNDNSVGSSQVLSPGSLIFHKCKKSSQQETKDTAEPGGSPVWELGPDWVISPPTSFSQLQQEPSLQEFHLYLPCKLGIERIFLCPLKLRTLYGFLDRSRLHVQFEWAKICIIFFLLVNEKQR